MFVAIFLSMCMGFVLYYCAYWYLSKPMHIPPGPHGYPFIGTWIDLDREHTHYTDLAREFGPIYHYYSGSQLVVVLNNYEVIKEALIRNGDVFADRPLGWVAAMDHRGRGITFSNGDRWKEQRRFALHTLRDFGFGRAQLEQHISQEIDALIKEMETMVNTSADVRLLFSNAVANVICQMMFKKRFEYNQAEFIDQIERISKRNSSARIALQVIDFPFAGYFFARSAVIRQFLGSGAASRRYLMSLAKECREKYTDNMPPTCFVDAFLKEQKTGNPEFDDEQLAGVLQNLFFGGIDTTATTMRYAILLFMLHPEVQDKARQEITNLVGSERRVSLSDRQNLPYFQATLHEIQRVANLVPTTIRQTREDVIIKGYKIPAETPVIVNLWAVLLDSDRFDEPHTFKPERFLDPDGRFVQDEELIAFGVGKRVCPGESMARMELFLMLAALLQRFRFRVPPGQRSPAVKHQLGLVVQPGQFNVYIQSAI